MITKEVNDWVRKVETGNYSYQDIMEEFVKYVPFLTKAEMVHIKKRIDSFIRR